MSIIYRKTEVDDIKYNYSEDISTIKVKDIAIEAKAMWNITNTTFTPSFDPFSMAEESDIEITTIGTYSKYIRYPITDSAEFGNLLVNCGMCESSKRVVGDDANSLKGYPIIVSTDYVTAYTLKPGIYKITNSNGEVAYVEFTYLNFSLYEGDRHIQETTDDGYYTGKSYDIHAYMYYKIDTNRPAIIVHKHSGEKVIITDSKISGTNIYDVFYRNSIENEYAHVFHNDLVSNYDYYMYGFMNQHQKDDDETTWPYYVFQTNWYKYKISDLDGYNNGRISLYSAVILHNKDKIVIGCPAYVTDVSSYSVSSWASDDCILTIDKNFRIDTAVADGLKYVPFNTVSGASTSSSSYSTNPTPFLMDHRPLSGMYDKDNDQFVFIGQSRWKVKIGLFDKNMNCVNNKILEMADWDQRSSGEIDVIINNISDNRYSNKAQYNLVKKIYKINDRYVYFGNDGNDNRGITIRCLSMNSEYPLTIKKDGAVNAKLRDEDGYYSLIGWYYDTFCPFFGFPTVISQTGKNDYLPYYDKDEGAIFFYVYRYWVGLVGAIKIDNKLYIAYSFQLRYNDKPDHEGDPIGGWITTYITDKVYLLISIDEEFKLKNETGTVDVARVYDEDGRMLPLYYGNNYIKAKNLAEFCAKHTDTEDLPLSITSGPYNGVHYYFTWNLETSGSYYGGSGTITLHILNKDLTISLYTFDIPNGMIKFSDGTSVPAFSTSDPYFYPVSNSTFAIYITSTSPYPRYIVLYLDIIEKRIIEAVIVSSSDPYLYVVKVYDRSQQAYVVKDVNSKIIADVSNDIGRFLSATDPSFSVCGFSPNFDYDSRSFIFTFNDIAGDGRNAGEIELQDPLYSKKSS